MARFAAVGLAGVVVNTAALYLLVQWAGVLAWFGAAVSAELALVHNFAFNSTWTFRNAGGRTGLVGRFLRYNMICGAAIGINVLVVWLLTAVTDIHYLIANLVGIGCGLAWNYGMNVSFTWALLPARTSPD
jgi:putative flippase GtrA